MINLYLSLCTNPQAHLGDLRSSPKCRLTQLTSVPVNFILKFGWIPESFPREKLQRHKADKPLANIQPPVVPIRMGLVRSVNNYVDPKPIRISRLTSQVIFHPESVEFNP
jgi:hypothetical protein